MAKEYKLSACLYGHSLDVRSLCVTPNNDIVTGSRDKTARFWKLNKLSSGYQEVMCYRDQKNFVGSVVYLEPSEEYPDGLIVAGGNDNLILIYKPSEPFASFTLKEHTNAVCCLSKCKEPNSFLSSSWDTTAKYWTISSSKALVTFSGHTASVWSAIQITDGRIVTASADRTIGIWSSSGQKLNSLTGHTDCVRTLIDFPETNSFLSASNDASIKTWSYSGENINTYYGHTSFIYCLARCPTSGDNFFVSSDENRSVKVWLNGESIQTITLPAQSVWTIACLSNGDIVTGSSDGLVRIFTQDESRVADEATMTKFNEEVNAVLAQSMQQIGGYKVSDLPGKEALYDPGKTAGQNKMVREGNGVILYTWVEDGTNSHWEKVGDVLGGTDKDDSGKTMFEGKAYDFVFSVDVEDGKPPLKLPFNKGDDPYQEAHKFLNKNMLPAEYLEQVVDFILKNSNEKFVAPSSDYVDPFTGGARYTPNYSNGQNSAISGNADPFTGGSSYSTAASRVSTSTSSSASTFFPLKAYRTFDMGDPKVILNKLKEFNKHSAILVDEDELEELVKICGGPLNDPKTVDLLFQLLDWPDDIVFPVLDIVRMAVRNKTNNDVISNVNNGILMEKLLNYLLEHKIENNIVVALRTICNLCVHESGENLVFNKRFELMENFTASKQLNKNGQVALSTVLLNLTVLTVKRSDELGYSILAEVLPDILTKLTDIESQFRIYVALGTLITQANSHLQEVKVKINGNPNFLSTIQLHILGGASELETKRMNCVKEVQSLL